MEPAPAQLQKVQEVGEPADDFTLPGVNGGQISLASLLEGKKGAVVVFWSGVCSHCIRYDGYLNGFAERHPDLALAVVASRAGETPEQISKTMAERGITFPIAHDKGSPVARQWFTQQTPRAFLIDPGRVILYRGAIDNFKYPGDPEYIPHLEGAIADFLAGNPVRRTETASFGCAINSVYYTLPKHL
jgi:peroxiredoxin